MIKPAALTRSQSSLRRGYTLAFVGTAIWSTTGPMIAVLLANSTLGSLTLAAWRDLFAALILGAFLAVRAPQRLYLARRDWLLCLGYGLALAALNATWTESVVRNGAAVSTVLVYMAPAFVALGAHWLFGEALNRRIGLALALSLAGVALVAGLYDPSQLARDPWSTALGIVPGILMAVYSLFGMAAARRGLHVTTVMVYSFGIAGVILFLAQASTGVPRLEPSVWLGLLFLAAVPTLGGYGLYTASLAYLPGATASLITTLEPALTALLAWAFLGETLTPTQLIGGALIVGSVMTLTVTDRQPDQKGL